MNIKAISFTCLLLSLFACNNNTSKQETSITDTIAANTTSQDAVKTDEAASDTAKPLFSQDEIEQQIVFIREKFATITSNRENNKYETIKFTVEGSGEFINYERSNNGNDVKFLSVAYCSDHGCETSSYYFWDNQIIFMFEESSSWVGDNDEMYEKRTYYLDEIEIRCLEREHRGTGGYDKVKAQLSKVKQQTLDCSSKFDRSTISELLKLSETNATEFFFGSSASATDNSEDKFLELGFEWMNKEQIGEISLNTKPKELTELLGKPDYMGEQVYWGADGLTHQDLSFDENGLTINVIVNSGTIESIHSIKARKPCEFTTSKGISIGSSYVDVVEAYDNSINTSESYPTIIVVGTVYGGVIFTFENSKVYSIFIGAAAE